MILKKANSEDAAILKRYISSNDLRELTRKE